MPKITLDEFCSHWVSRSGTRVMASRLEFNVFDFATAAGEYTRQQFVSSFASGAVSYTHLDVYKRQTYWRSVNAGTTTGRRTGNGWSAGTISWSAGMPSWCVTAYAPSSG